PIRQLPPEVAPDVRGHVRVFFEVPERASQLLDARGHAPVDLADHDGAATGVFDEAGLEVIRAEVDEAADRARIADDPFDDQLVEAVLCGDDVAVGAEV